MNSQLILCTPVPQILALNPDVIKVSIVTSPRLGVAGAPDEDRDRLGAWPDWLDWTQRRKDGGLTFTFGCGPRTMDVAADLSATEPVLWGRLFHEDTRVVPYVFDDLSERLVRSWSVRSGLALVKATYQAAGVEFALPAGRPTPPCDDVVFDDAGRLHFLGGEAGATADTRQLKSSRQRLDCDPTLTRRTRFAELLQGYAVNWNAGLAARARDRLGRRQSLLIRHLAELSATFADQGTVNAVGEVPTGVIAPNGTDFKARQSSLTTDFSLFHDMPQVRDADGNLSQKGPDLDRDRVLDFHRAVSSLGAYPDVMRRLGLVVDLELPTDFFEPTQNETPGILTLQAVAGDWDEGTDTTVPVTRVAYALEEKGDQRLFAVSPASASAAESDLGVLGLLNLDPGQFGVAQADIDGALHKTILHAENTQLMTQQNQPLHPEVYDPGTALSALRSGGFTIFADSRAIALLKTFARSRQMNEDVVNRDVRTPFSSADLTRGFRLDVWDSVTQKWHSLHERTSTIRIGEGDEVDESSSTWEGWFQPAVTQAAPNEDGTRDHDDLYLHEAIVRWDGWSLSARAVDAALSSQGDPDRALEAEAKNEPVTPFKVVAEDNHVPGSLPRLRFGVGYRFRLRHVDLAGNGLPLDSPETRQTSPIFSLPRGDETVGYLRFEPVVAPAVVACDDLALRGRGSSLDRIVIRSFNTDESKDRADLAEVNGAERHIAPPVTNVRMAERHGMFDDAAGRINGSHAMWQLIADRDAGAFAEEAFPEIVIDGVVQQYPVDRRDQIDPLPYLPDPLARAAAFRNLPGSFGTSSARVAPGAGPAGPIAYEPLDDPRPRPGAVTIVEFGGRDDWREIKPFRLALAGGDATPSWDPDHSVLTVSLPLGTTSVVPVSSCPDSDDLKLLGVWDWLREYVEHAGVHKVASEFGQSPAAKDRLVHVLQLAGEGGHAMLTPPHLLTLVHAVQQPVGRPTFGRLNAELGESRLGLQTEPESSPTQVTELSPITAWRPPGSTDAWLIGALAIHAASTAKVDLMAAWSDWADDPTPQADGTVAPPRRQSFGAAADEVPINRQTEGYLIAQGEARAVGYYDLDHDLVCFAPLGTRLGNLNSGAVLSGDTMPRHRFGDTKHHVVTYTPKATSRYREYFEDGLDVTRTGDPVEVHVPASTRPVAPAVRYVVPTFGWDRVTSSDQHRSVRTGGGLRVYLDRPWYSSGDGQRLGVALATSAVDPHNPADRVAWKPYITQWGQDPIWSSTPLAPLPALKHFPQATETEPSVSLDSPLGDTSRNIGVAGNAVAYDDVRGLYYCDITVDPQTATYMPFIRLALVAYQPHALVDAKVSRVVLTDVAQLTPERILTITSDPARSGTWTWAISGPGPHQQEGEPHTEVQVTVQERDANASSDLGWSDSADFAITTETLGPDPSTVDFLLEAGTVTYRGQEPLASDRYRLLVTEHEVYEVDGSEPGTSGVGRRLVYAETVALDTSLVTPAAYPATPVIPV
ncbi:MAG: hypothetical protein WCG47_28540 [Dermatophilaceae bacterium]